MIVKKLLKIFLLINILQNLTSLTAINSINWARIIAQSVYFFWAFLANSTRKTSKFYCSFRKFWQYFFSTCCSKYGFTNKGIYMLLQIKMIFYIRTISFWSNDYSIRLKKLYSPSMDIQISSNFERQIFESVNS